MLVLDGCHKEQQPDTDSSLDSYSFSIGTSPTKGRIGTWNDRSAEDLLTEVRIALYCGGCLLCEYDFGSGDKVELNKASTYSIYAVSALGEEWEWPLEEADLAAMAFPVASDMASYRTRGIPTFGCLQGMRPEAADASDGSTDGCITLNVRRLFARVTFHYNPAFSTTAPFHFDELLSLQVHNANAVLRPFAGDCKALSASDIRQNGNDGESGSYLYSSSPDALILYIPENMQGDRLPGNDDPYRKTPASLEERSAGSSLLCTYLQASVHGDEAYLEGVGGEAVYRFYLGMDTDSNFDVRGNTDYDVTLTLTADGLGLTGHWKVDTGNLTDNRFFRFGAHERTVRPGGTVYVRCSYGADDSWNDFSSPWSESWGFYAGSQASYDVFKAYGTTDPQEVHLHGTSVRCPECGRLYTGLPDKHASDVARLGAAAVSERQRQWLSYNLEYHSYPSGSYTWEYWCCKACGEDLMDSAIRTDRFATEDIPSHFLETGEETAHYLWAGVPSTLPLGSVYTLYGGSRDGRYTDRLDIQVGRETAARFNTSRLPRYIAQQGTLQATLPDDVSGVSYHIKSVTTEGMIEVADNSGAADNTSCTIRSLAGGTAVLRAVAKGTGELMGEITLEVRLPRIRFENVPELRLDGAYVSVGMHYEKEDGSAMTVAASDAEGYGNAFAPSLYASLLGNPVAEAGTGAAAAFLAASGTEVHISRLSHAGTPISSLYGLQGDALSARPARMAGTPLGSGQVRIIEPLVYTWGHFVTIDDWTVMGPFGGTYASTATSQKLLPGGSLSFNRPLTLQVAASALSYSAVPVDIDTQGMDGEQLNEVSFGNLSASHAGNTLTVTLSDSADDHLVGKAAVLARVTNAPSGEFLLVELGTIDAYMHTVIGGRLMDFTLVGVNGGLGVTVYPLGEEKLPAAFRTVISNVLNFNDFILTDGVRTNVPFYDGGSVNLTYTHPGTVNWSNGLPVYEIDFMTNGVTELTEHKFTRMYYGYFTPDVVIDNDAASLQGTALTRNASTGAWHYALGGVKDASGRGYYIFQFLHDLSPTEKGWFNYYDFY